MITTANYRKLSLIKTNSLLIHQKFTFNNIKELQNAANSFANSLIEEEKDSLFQFKKEKYQEKEIAIYKAKQLFLRKGPTTRRLYGHFKCCRRA